MSTSNFSSRIHTDQDLIDRLEKSSWRNTWAMVKSNTKLSALTTAGLVGCGAMVYFINTTYGPSLSGLPSFFAGFFGLSAFVCLFSTLMILILSILPTWLSFGLFTWKRKSIVDRFSNALSSATLQAVGYLDYVNIFFGIQDLGDLVRVPQQTIDAMVQDQEIKTLCVSQWGADWPSQSLRKINMDWLATKIPGFDGRLKASQEYLYARAKEPSVDTFVLIPEPAPAAPILSNPQARA